MNFLDKKSLIPTNEGEYADIQVQNVVYDYKEFTRIIVNTYGIKNNKERNCIRKKVENTYSIAFEYPHTKESLIEGLKNLIKTIEKNE